MIYAFGVELRTPFNEALEQVTRAMQEEGLGVVSDVDVQAVMHKKLQEEIPHYRILGACAPLLAKRVMEADPEAGALLPCNIIVREITPELTGVTFMDPEAVFGLSDEEAVREAGREARRMIEAVRDRLTGQHPVDLT
ncbi:MAG: DUF302 domain-containing protein [Pseudomonadota bacterium]|nr:DUF302 domain-containing protein [Pseudomonadota bacterium]